MRILSISLLVLVLIAAAVASSEAIDSFDSMVAVHASTIERGY